MHESQEAQADAEASHLLQSNFCPGRAPVNSYFGAFKRLANGGIEMSGAFGTTKMAGPPELMQAEDTFLRALAGVSGPAPTELPSRTRQKNIVLDFGLSQ